MRKYLVALAALTMMTSSALADFKFAVTKDEFDGSEHRFISTDANGAHGAMAIFPAQGKREIAADGFIMIWKPISQFICGSQWRFVHWRHVDESGQVEQVAKRDYVVFDIRASKDSLQTTLSDFQNDTSKRELFEAMKKPGSIRLTYTDECGQRVIEEFPTKGFAPAVIEAGS